MVHVDNRARARTVVQIRTDEIDNAPKWSNNLKMHTDDREAGQKYRRTKSASIGLSSMAGSDFVSDQRVRLKWRLDFDVPKQGKRSGCLASWSRGATRSTYQRVEHSLPPDRFSITLLKIQCPLILEPLAFRLPLVTSVIRNVTFLATSSRAFRSHW